MLLLAAAAPAHATRWTAPAEFTVGGADVDPVPRVAISADGRAIAAWAARGRGLVVRSGRRGRFARATVLTRKPIAWAVAPGAVAWQERDGIHVARRDGRRWRARRVATSTGSAINGVAIAADPLGGWVVAERQFSRRAYRVRVLSLDADGRRVGSVQDLGLGEFGIDALPTQALAVQADGTAVVAFVRERADASGPLPAVVAARPHGGAFGEPVELDQGGGTEPRVIAAGAGTAVAATDVDRCGDAGCFGAPVVSRLASGVPGPGVSPRLEHPGRAFGPWALPTADGGALAVFSLKARPEAFSRLAPVRAVRIDASGVAGPLQTLARSKASEPVALPLAGGRTLAMWATVRGFRAALAGTSGRFRPTAAPAGAPPGRFHFNSTNRDIRTGGAWAIVGWTRKGVVRLSVRRF